jgi:hypothetical protein
MNRANHIRRNKNNIRYSVDIQTLAPVRTPGLLHAPTYACRCCVPKDAALAAVAGPHAPTSPCYMCPHAPATRVRMRLLLLRAYTCHAAAHARHAARHARGDGLCQRSLPLLANENTCNMKHLLQQTSERDETFGNICLQCMCIDIATYATFR